LDEIECHVRCDDFSSGFAATDKAIGADARLIAGGPDR
jgi:hypothetical protein